MQTEKIKIDLDSGTKTVGLPNLTGILGYRSSNGTTYNPHISDRPVDIGPDGSQSVIITSLPIDGTKPLFGIVTKYNDIESQ
ncbi:Hypothetical predicted protein, partial [Paramuricea clavata]